MSFSKSIEGSFDKLFPTLFMFKSNDSELKSFTSDSEYLSSFLYLIICTLVVWAFLLPFIVLNPFFIVVLMVAALMLNVIISYSKAVLLFIFSRLLGKGISLLQSVQLSIYGSTFINIFFTPIIAILLLFLPSALLDPFYNKSSVYGIVWWLIFSLAIGVPIFLTIINMASWLKKIPGFSNIKAVIISALANILSTGVIIIVLFGLFILVLLVAIAGGGVGHIGH